MKLYSWCWALAVVVVLLTLPACRDSEQEKACKDARWSSKAAWSESEREFEELRGWLRQYDVWHLQSRNPTERIGSGSKMEARTKKWSMWKAAGKAAAEASERAWEQPSKAVFHSRQATTACNEAENSSPPVQKRVGSDASEDEPDDVIALDWYTPGQRALAACRAAGVKAEEAWKLCNFSEPVSEEEKALEKTDISFF